MLTKIFGILLYSTLCHYAFACAQGKVYYISATGKDSNTGASVAGSFRTLNKLNSIDLKPGDVVRFKRGDIFRGQLTIKRSGTVYKPIVIDAYGTGRKPMIVGSVPLTKWILKAPNIWETKCADCGVNVTGVYLNSRKMPLGRYPNPEAPGKGYLTVKAHLGKDQLISKEALDNNWAGAEAVIRTQEWVLDRAKIVNQAADTLNLYNNSYEPRDDWGYFIQDHPATLDRNGEWYYNKQTRNLSIYYQGPNINNQHIEATVYSKGISLENSNYITIQNLKISQTLNYGLFGSNTSGLTVKNVDIDNCGEDAILLNGKGRDLLFENCTVNQVNNNAVTISGASYFPFTDTSAPGYTNLIFRRNTIKNVATTAGMGKGGEGQYFAFAYGNDDGNALIENNVLDSLGYIGISFIASNITIKNNVVSNYNLVKSDGGGIYTWNGIGKPKILSNQKIISNIVINSRMANEGTNNQYAGAPGIYIDDCSQNIEISNNTVANCSGSGIKLHGTNNIYVAGNTCYNNNVQNSIELSRNCDNQSNHIINNTFISKNVNQAVAMYMTAGVNFNSVATFSKNHYSRPLNDIAPMVVNLNNKAQNMSLAEWKQKFAADVNSTTRSIASKHLIKGKVDPDDVFFFRYNASDKPKKIMLKGIYRDARSKLYSNSLILQPYTSVVLIKE